MRIILVVLVTAALVLVALPQSTLGPDQTSVRPTILAGDLDLLALPGNQSGDSVSARAIEIADDGAVYVAGYYQGEMQLAGSNLSSPDAPFSNLFVARMWPDGSWDWAIQGGNLSHDEIYDLALDGNGDAYVAGYYCTSSRFGTIELTTDDTACEGMVARVGSNGTWLWATRIGGGNSSRIEGIATDTGGNSYVTGSFSNNVTFGATEVAAEGGNDIFVARIDSSGIWDWVATANGSGNGEGTQIAVAPNGTSYVGGIHTGDFWFGSTMLPGSSGNDLWVASLDASGSWDWTLGEASAAQESVLGLDLDPSGNITISGTMAAALDFNGTVLDPGGWSTPFVARLKPTGHWVWATRADSGGTNHDTGLRVSVDSRGHSVVTGILDTEAVFGPFTLGTEGGSDIFVATLDEDGVWTTARGAGSAGFDIGRDVAMSSDGTPWVTGTYTASATFGVDLLPLTGSADSFVWHYDVDVDQDQIGNSRDRCAYGSSNWTSTSESDHDLDGCADAWEDLDDDNDGVEDTNDTCSRGITDWSSGPATDYDSDGCADWLEDLDNDGDSIPNAFDRCPTGLIGSDHDLDGCEDDAEDSDDDDDGLHDLIDMCPRGAIGWMVGPSEDFDLDGCRDADEDQDDDGDGVPDITDICPSTPPTLITGADGCPLPAPDRDGDGVDDINDTFPDEPTQTSDSDADGYGDNTSGHLPDACPALWGNSTTPLGCPDDDGDGFANSTDEFPDDPTESSDADGDGLGDHEDQCSSTSGTGADGCPDSDSDGIPDDEDNCDQPNAAQQDHDDDGSGDPCDDDDDSDGIPDLVDECPRGLAYWSSDEDTDPDGDGCASIEDLDDDGDTIVDEDDNCPARPNPDQQDIDFDAIGDSCDPDDDNDGIIDQIDQCAGTLPTDPIDASGCKREIQASEPATEDEGLGGGVGLLLGFLIGVVIAGALALFLGHRELKGPETLELAGPEMDTVIEEDKGETEQIVEKD